VFERKSAYQWDNAYQDKQASMLKVELLEQASQMLRARAFPDEILRKQYLRIAALIYEFGVRDYSYVIQAGWKYYSYWNLCGGRFMLPSRCDDGGSFGIKTVSRRYEAEPELTSSTAR